MVTQQPRIGVSYDFIIVQSLNNKNNIKNDQFMTCNSNTHNRQNLIKKGIAIKTVTATAML